MKRRFGVSIPKDLADRLDLLAKALETDRSSLIEAAVREYIHDHMHYLVPHDCTGIMVLYGACRKEDWFDIIDRYMDIVVSYNHIHRKNICIEVLIVSGPSKKIASLHKELVESGIKARYLPIFYCVSERS
ncbi:MAG: CopG family transcriptional regulator [Thermoprotei archaeon]|nr:MAG: CopG family transcriptional regulator [Thermoprotei archaeon]